MAVDDGFNVAVEIAELRGEMTAGFARLEGQLNLINQTQQRTAQDFRDLETRTAQEFRDLETKTDAKYEVLEGRVTALESRRWPIGIIAGTGGAISAAAAVVALIVTK